MIQFVKIKKALDNSIEQSFLTENKVQLKEAFGEIKTNKDLQLLYYCINNLQNPPKMDESEIKEFIEENIKLAKQVKLEELSILAEKLENEKLTSVEEDINLVLFSEKSAFNLLEYNQAKKNIIESIRNKVKPVDLDLNEFSTEDVAFVKTLIDKPEETFKNLCQECLDILNAKLNEEVDLNTKLLIYETREKIFKSQIDFKFLPENVIEILNLKNDLIAG